MLLLIGLLYILLVPIGVCGLLLYTDAELLALAEADMLLAVITGVIGLLYEDIEPVIVPLMKRRNLKQ